MGKISAGNISRGEYFGWGKLRAGKTLAPPQIWVPCVQLQEPQSLGCTADTRKHLLGYTHWVHKIIHHTGYPRKIFGIRKSINTDPDTQYTGTSTSRHKKNAPCRRREQEIAQIAQKLFWGRDFGTNVKIPPPPEIFLCRNTPPPNVGVCILTIRSYDQQHLASLLAPHWPAML